MCLLPSLPLKCKLHKNRDFVLSSTVTSVPECQAHLDIQSMFAEEMTNYLEYKSEPFLLYIYLLHTFLVLLSNLHINLFFLPFLPPPLFLPTTFFQQKYFSLCYTRQMSNGYTWIWFLILT